MVSKLTTESTQRTDLNWQTCSAVLFTTVVVVEEARRALLANLRWQLLRKQNQNLIRFTLNLIMLDQTYAYRTQTHVVDVLYILQYLLEVGRKLRPFLLTSAEFQPRNAAGGIRRACWT